MDHEFRAGTQGWTIVGQIAHRFKSAWKKSFDLDLCINALTGISPALYVNVTLFFRFRIWIYEKTGPFQTAGFSWNSACHGKCFWGQVVGPSFWGDKGHFWESERRGTKPSFQGCKRLMFDDDWWYLQRAGGQVSNSSFPRNLYHNLPRMVIHDTFKSLKWFPMGLRVTTWIIIIVGMMRWSLSQIQLTTVIYLVT